MSDISSFLRKQESRSLFPRKRESIGFWIPVVTGKYWIPAYAGMTVGEPVVRPHSVRILDNCYNHTTITDLYGAHEDHPHETPFELVADEPPVLLGEDNGPNPVEYLLTALVGCLTSSLIYHAAAKGIEIKGVESRLEGDIDLRGFLGLSPDVKVGYENIRVYFNIDADISEGEKEELIRMAQKYSPVFNSVANPVPVSVQLDK